MSGSASSREVLYITDALFYDCYNILQNESLKKIKCFKLRIHGSSNNLLIFMRRYEVMDFPGFFF